MVHSSLFLFLLHVYNVGVMKKNLIKLAIISSVFAVGLGLMVNKTNKTATPLEAAVHLDNYDTYTYSGNYYSAVNTSGTDGLQGTFRKSLSSKIFPANWYTYSSLGENNLSTQLQYADEDPTNSSNMVYLYTRNSIAKNNGISGNGDWNREHVWPQNNSNGNWDDSTGKLKAGTDILHIRPTYEKTNNDRGNLKYGDINKSNPVYYNSMLYGYKGTYFEPIDSVKGDVARIVMYVWTAYYDHYGDSGLLITKTFDSYNTLLKWHTMDKPDAMEGHRNNYSEQSRQQNRNPFVDHPEYAWRIFGDSASPEVKQACMAAYPGEGGQVTPTKQLQSISISGNATKKDYYAGESFNPAGLTVTASYNDGSTQNISTSSCTWTPNPLTVGTTSVTCTYQQKTATYSGITVSERTNPPSGDENGTIYSVTFNSVNTNTSTRLDLDGVMAEAKDNSLIKSVTAATNVFSGQQYGLKLGSSGNAGSVSFEFVEGATENIEKIKIETKKYYSDSALFTAVLGSTTITESGTPGEVYEQNFNDISASTLTISTDDSRMYLSKITIVIKAEEVPPTPGPRDSSSSQNYNPGESSSSQGDNSSSASTEPGTNTKRGCSGSIVATLSFTSISALIGLVFIFSKKKK